ncbi:MarR family transcriptional regulator [Micromonospora sp. 15K316]|uniref:MarR family winged helix-turn-helix transcriptional regulator n=1 Tax=Micromonospora sp. 15K316 TaxID=2530376 RepID=UPI00104AA44D|nr:MarR family transcriptional regulator [Micromonospora sp. 15K316]TDC40572.1 MarR family transcriptional regulator [Micromonospora sp. 15K316]
MASDVLPATASAGPETGLVESLSALSRALVGITTRTLASLDADLTLSQYRAIVVLASHGPLRTVDLAAALHVHPSTATRTCDRLVRRGLVARHQKETDRRVSWLGLTPGGKELVGEVMRRRAAQIRELVDSPETGAAGNLAELVEALAVAAGEPTERQWWQRWERCTEAVDGATGC